MRQLLLALAMWALASLPGYARAQIQDIPHPTLPPCQEGDPDLLLPDLVPEVPIDVRNVYAGGRRVIEFTTAVENIGDGPLVIEGRTISLAEGLVTQGWQIIWRRDGSQCARTTGRFEFHPQHRHFHFERFVGYELRSGDAENGPMVATGGKASFCLLDIDNIRGYHPDNFPRQVTNLTCDQEGIQGISVGWRDIYERFLAGQSIVLDMGPGNQVPEGSYFLVNRVDPDHLVWEKDRSNNASFAVASVSLPPPDPSVFRTPVATPRARHPNLNSGRPRPTRGVRSRPSRGPRVRSTPTPTVTPTPLAIPTRTRPVTGPATPTPRFAGFCENACDYTVSQVRMTWYEALGLNVSFFVGPRACRPLTPEAGEEGSIEMQHFLTETGRDTGLEHTAGFVMDDSVVGASSSGGVVRFSRASHGFNVTYLARVPPLASADDRLQFPVVFDMCLTLGEQAVKARLVCQPKTTGMLCHQG